MKSRFNPASFEDKWKQNWEDTKVYATKDTNGNKSYVLVMFPYPSGAGLHVGHVRVYTGTDVIARYLRMKGDSVLHPMGWDAFGLPAENAAIKAKKNPMDMVPDNIANFKRQMIDTGLSYDWDKEFATTDPEYYKWTQWLFIQFFKMGLLYKKDTAVYFCEFCKTGLAEEEVTKDDTHERCGNPIIRKNLPQWIFNITAYADRLESDLKDLDWPEGILAMQKKWIGRKEAMEIEFKISNIEYRVTNEQSNDKKQEPTSDIRNPLSVIRVTTSRWETIYGVTYLVLAPEHEFIKQLIENGKASQEVSEYVASALSKTDQQRMTAEKDKTGVFTGLYAINPVNNKEVPIWVADYVLSNVGTGAVMGVPAHDARDKEFADKFSLPFIKVLDNDTLINSDIFNGKSQKDAQVEIKDFIEKNSFGKKTVTYHLRDWIFSRQRYWGEPIPMVYCEECKWVPLAEEMLPLKLPYIKSYEPSSDGSSPLSQIDEFVKTTCPNCGKDGRRETDTMPNWAGSCWYFLAFPWWKKMKETEELDSVATAFSQSSLATAVGSPSTVVPPNSRFPSTEAWQKEIIEKWAPVDWYIGGAEHAVLHLLYSRFWVKALQDKGLLGFAEPFRRLRNVGMVLAEDHRKMSKSFGNVINPDDVIQEYGADTLRVYEMFMAPFNQDIAWSTKAMQGSYRFLVRTWHLYTSGDYITEDDKKEEIKIVIELQNMINKVGQDITDVKFNTAISAMMTFLNKWEEKSDKEVRKLSMKNAKKFLQVLAPFAPFITEELWHSVCKEENSIHMSQWPEVEKIENTRGLHKIAIQVDGKFRGVIETESSVEEDIIAKALENEKIKKYIADNNYTTVYIKDKVLNFVLTSSH